MAEQGLQDYLAQLEGQRANLSIQIAGVRIALGLPPEDGVAGMLIPPMSPAAGSSAPRRDTVPGRIRPDEFFKMSVPEAVLAFLDIMKQPQSPKAIAEGLKAGGILSEAKHFYANVFTALKRLRAQNQVVNTKSGGWGRSDWYEGRSGTDVASKPKRKKKGSKSTKKSKKAAGTKAAPSHKSAYHAFLAAQLKAGKTMKEAGEMWRAQKKG